MRIAIISTPFLPVPPRTYGGTELVVHELVEGLLEQGHDVGLFATGDSQSRAPTRALFPTAHWPPESLTDVEHAAWALGEVVRRDFDVVHVHSASVLPMMRLVPSLPPLVYTLHHPREERLSALYRRHPEPWYVAISASQARREIALPRLTVIHHGLDPGVFGCTDRAPDRYVCFVGRLSEEKGTHTAIDAAGIAGVPIHVAGEVHPPDRAFAEREVLPRLNQPHVTYLGNIGPAVKRPLLCDARALLVPIEWEEPFGLIMIEAMLSGCPVVAFPRGSVSELVEEGRTGFIVSGLDEMVAAIRPGGPVDSFDRRACRARAIERFSRRRMAMEHERLYARCVAEYAVSNVVARAISQGVDSLGAFAPVVANGDGGRDAGRAVGGDLSSEPSPCLSTTLS
jgi:glycosyltransferase involved in cell wall biosynthesis